MNRREQLVCEASVCRVPSYSEYNVLYCTFPCFLSVIKIYALPLQAFRTAEVAAKHAFTDASKFTVPYTTTICAVCCAISDRYDG